MSTDTQTTVPLPPVDAEVFHTACEFCPVACRYRVIRWPVGSEGGPDASDNALGVSVPVGIGQWVSPNMHNVVMHEGRQVNVIVQPDPDADVMNVGGEHSIRGGVLARKLYNPGTPTKDRLTTPLLRVRGLLQPISWDAALEIFARVSEHVIANHTEMAWGTKVYSYQYFENTYAISKLSLGAIGTPNWAPHHAPAEGDDTPGLSDCGVDAFNSAYIDDQEADVLLLVGTDPYETKTVRFTQWMRRTPIVDINPRKGFTARYAEENGGLHLQVQPGTDTALMNAIAREVIEQGWEDTEFISTYMASRAEIDAEGKWRRVRFGQSFDEYKAYLLSKDEFTPEGAEAVTKVPAAKIRQAAEMLAKPNGDGTRKKTSVRFEKGLYWSHNYENTASIGSLGLLLGAAGRPGQNTSRLGGHQRGGMKGGSYPIEKSPHEFEGHKLEMDQDRYFMEGNTRFMWVIGTNWVGASAASESIRAKLKELNKNTGPEVTSTSPPMAIAALNAKVDAGGTVVVHQELYPNATTEFADLVLPAAGWGEETTTRMSAERRLFLYEKVADAPGEATPDWKIASMIAQRMGFDGFDWADSNEVFEEAGPKSGGRKAYNELVIKAQEDGVRAHDLLKTYSDKRAVDNSYSEASGIQCPIVRDGDDLKGTIRLHGDMKFKTDSGKANFVLPDWDAVDARMDILRAGPGEYTVLNGRVNALWNNLGDQLRMGYHVERWPVNFLEVSPADASANGIESGDWIRTYSDTVINQLGEQTSAEFTAVAYVTDAVPDGVLYTYFNFPGQPANNVVPADTTLQPLNLRYNFKLGRGKIENIGPSEYKDAFQMSFAPRNIVK
jgi:arsenite oxidase large subunit